MRGDDAAAVSVAGAATPGWGVRRRLRLRSLMRDEGGSASLEFITVGLLMLVPLIYLVGALGMIQGQALGVEAAARHTARAISPADGCDPRRGGRGIRHRTG